ncbi:phosphatase PAP2 family protein [Qaidamihabitans albus]|uniref:phosphatase PAP2 family protein n=1 Tax=Qaidamihabitans albus TaxID=2795733 RepID=UPI0018F250FF|nr:phosphatase PAP2 family protein [Qaidamihabitans albus]
MKRYVLLGGLLLSAFVALGLVVHGAPARPDAAVAGTLEDRWRGPLGDVAAGVSAVLGPVLPVLLGVSLLVVAWLLWRRAARARAGLLLRLLLLLALCRSTSFTFKPLFERERPREYVDFAYPSGHVVSVASTGFVVVVLCLWLARRLVRRAAWAACVATALCAVSRMALGVHWLTDTVGAVLAVGGVGLLAGAALRLLPAPDPVPAGRRAA